ncbi:SbtA family thio(seleno)oxazole RiPP natural product precursor [Thermodesulfobacteriota bacterium]
MDFEQLKKVLAGFGVATLIAGSTLTLSGCPGDKSGSSSQSDTKQEAPGKSA